MKGTINLIYNIFLYNMFHFFENLKKTEYKSSNL